MLRHIGEHRSFTHNIRLAALLSWNAGMINAAGFIAFSVLTTNVTGHAALLAVNTASGHWREARMVALWLSLFLAGAFFSAWLIGRVGRQRSLAYTLPILLIIGILVGVIVWGPDYDHALWETELFAGGLLFSMGMQNALVSVISGSVVRTTHLTGMVTDLGIDLSAALHSQGKASPVVLRRIKLRLVIIGTFLSGGLLGGFLFLQIRFRTFWLPVGIMLTALFYDYLRIKLRLIIRERKQNR